MENQQWKVLSIMTDIEAGPPDILKIIRRGCKGSCSSRCSCKKRGLKYVFSYKEYHGVTCGNVTEDLDIIHGEDEDIDGNIFD